MSHLPEDLFARVRSLPPALSLEDVTQRFLNPVPLPQPRPWWRRHLKPLLMFAFLFSTLAALFIFSPSAAAPALSAFPLAGAGPAPVYAPAPLRAAGAVPLTIAPRQVTTPPVVPALPPPLPPAPASAPPAPAPAPPVVADARRHPAVAPSGSSRSQLPTALFRGEFKTLNTGLVLTFRETPAAASVHLLMVELPKEEVRAIKQTKTGTTTVERAAGTLLLYRNDGEDTFEFLPNPTYRADLTARGYAPTGVTIKNGFLTITKGSVIRIDPPRRVEDQLWFRYFTTDVDDEYIQLLQRFGYTSAELTELWRLPNAGMTPDDLRTLLPLLGRTLTERAPLSQLPHLDDLTDDLEGLARAGRQMSLAQLKASRGEPSRADLMRESAKQLATDEAATAARKRARDENFSTSRPGTTSATFAYNDSETITLLGNFKFRFNPDTTQRAVVVFGPERQVAKMNHKSDLPKLKLVHKSKKQPLYVLIPLRSHFILRPQRGTKIEVDSRKN